MKIILLFSTLFLSTSCKTNIVDHYDCSGKEELVSKTFTACVESSHQKECLETERASIKKTQLLLVRIPLVS